VRNLITDGPGVRRTMATWHSRRRRGERAPGGEPPVLTELGAATADCLARTVARGVYEAKALPDWRSKFDRH
jgi:L-aminopeptidase/D-esterase-like protein